MKMEVRDYTRIKDYLKAKKVVQNTPARIVNGECFRLVRGVWVSNEVFMKNNPVELRPTQRQLDNCDRKSARLL